jgi:hypothetical protein
MIELVDAAVGAAGAGVVAAVAGFIRSRAAKARRDERAQVIAMGEGMGIEYVPGEDFGRYRRLVCAARDDMALAETGKRLRERKRDEKGRFT